MKRISTLVAALVALASAPACDLINGPSELERQIAAEQEVIKAYSAAIPDVDALKQGFLDAWKSANELKDLKAYKDALQTKVVPGLTRYAEAMRDMPAGKGELADIHKGLVDAVEKARAAFASYADGVSEENFEAGYKDVLAAMEEVAAARATYIGKLEKHYARFRVDLVQGK
ncbi:MAG: hypothetical protein EP329_12205 [Deltaproteobacteria bacterium]|nr:MAG: hypothetical protein EP329_12205 [Deltaproteobacteria bacterium]